MSVINAKNADMSGAAPSQMAFGLGGSGLLIPDWEILLFPPDPSDPGDSYGRGVHFGSRIYKAELDQSGGAPDEDGSAEVTGLLTSDTAGSGDDGAADTREGDRIWLEIAQDVDTDTGLITASTFKIKSDEIDDDWGGGAFEFTTVSISDTTIDVIKYTRLLLGTVLDDGTGSGGLKVLRNIFGPLTLIAREVNSNDASSSTTAFVPALCAYPL